MLADLKVLKAVARCGVDDAGTTLKRDVVADDDQRIAVDEGVLADAKLHLRAGKSPQYSIIRNTGRLHDLGQQLFGDNIEFVIGLDQRIFIPGPDAKRQVCGQRPDGRCPDDHIGSGKIGAELGKQAALVVGDLELDIDGIAGILGVLNLSLSQRGLAVRAPVNRL
ncbi:hypothetical protein DSECCO2_652250 [anaerobic digester metagenome]